MAKTGITVLYARASCHDQKDDLVRQRERLEAYAGAHGWRSETITDLGSGVNCRKKGLRRLLAMIVAGRVERLVIEHRNRLLRFGADLVFALCMLRGVEIVMIDEARDASFESGLARDVIEIITVVSARLYGARAHKTRTSALQPAA